jgi:hypothetical protein
MSEEQPSSLPIRPRKINRNNAKIHTHIKG